jgi:hypothetical protein
MRFVVINSVMQPIFFKIENQPIMVIPNVQAQVDGHPVLTYTYNIYFDGGHEDADMLTSQENELLLEKKKDANYAGYITFEEPGKMFTYTADGQKELNASQVEEIIENITHFRDHPGMWNLEI